MVLTFRHSAWIIEFRREKLPRALTWALIVVLAIGFAYIYFENALPSPYGLCYVGRGGSKPCEPVNASPLDSLVLPLRQR